MNAVTMELLKCVFALVEKTLETSHLIDKVSLTLDDRTRRIVIAVRGGNASATNGELPPPAIVKRETPGDDDESNDNLSSDEAEKRHLSHPPSQALAHLASLPSHPPVHHSSRHLIPLIYAPLTPEDEPFHPFIDFPIQKGRRPGTTTSFQTAWYKKHPWISYSLETDMAYCFPCQRFGPCSF